VAVIAILIGVGLIGAVAILIYRKVVEHKDP
jgi:hypothetical protein